MFYYKRVLERQLHAAEAAKALFLLALGAALHASIDGVVAAVDGQRIEITGGGAA